MRLPISYFGVLFVVASISRFVFFPTITLNLGEWHKTFIDSRHLHGDTERFLTIILAVCRILDKLHSFSNILCTCSILIKM